MAILPTRKPERVARRARFCLGGIGGARLCPPYRSTRAEHALAMQLQVSRISRDECSAGERESHIDLAAA
jgi:hypothetical protein